MGPLEGVKVVEIASIGPGPGPAARPGEHTEEALRDWGFGLGEITDLLTKQAIVQLGVPR